MPRPTRHTLLQSTAGAAEPESESRLRTALASELRLSAPQRRVLEAWLQAMPARGQVRAGLLAQSWSVLMWQQWAQHFSSDPAAVERVEHFVRAAVATLMSSGDVDAFREQLADFRDDWADTADSCALIRGMVEQERGANRTALLRAQFVCGATVKALHAVLEAAKALVHFVEGADETVLANSTNAIVEAFEAWMDLARLYAPGEETITFESLFEQLQEHWDETRPPELRLVGRPVDLATRERSVAQRIIDVALEIGSAAPLAAGDALADHRLVLDQLLADLINVARGLEPESLLHEGIGFEHVAELARRQLHTPWTKAAGISTGWHWLADATVALAVATEQLWRRRGVLVSRELDRVEEWVDRAERQVETWRELHGHA